MMRLVRNEDIDKSKWDKCIAEASNSLIYANSFYLDVVSPGWMGVVEGDYRHVFPLPVGSKYGLKYVLHPLYSQQLGVFGPEDGPVLAEYLEASGKKWFYFNVHVNAQSIGDLKHKMEVRRNLILPLKDSMAPSKGYNQNTRRNLKKAEEAGITIRKGFSVGEFITFNKNSGNARLNEKAWQRMSGLVSGLQERQLGEFLVAELDGKILAAVFVATWSNRLTYLFSASSEEGKDKRAAFLLVDALVHQCVSRQLTLDFEGSMNTNIARFFSGFGAEEEEYYSYTDRFPWLKTYR